MLFSEKYSCVPSFRADKRAPIIIEGYPAAFRLLEPFASPQFFGSLSLKLFIPNRTVRRIVVKEAELFSEFPYPFPPQQITLFFVQ
jgi:hypothetical protein